MKPNPVHRLPAPLEAAVQRLKLVAREATERTIESLGLAALASANAYQRDGLLGAQFELNRKSAVFALAFNDALDERVLRELGPRASGADGEPGEASSGPLTDWAALSLVEDKEVEARISADRLGMAIAHACEWELRELEGYVSSLLGEAGGERDRNPLRADLLGHALIRGVEATSERPEIRSLLGAEIGRSLIALMPAAYAAIVAEMRLAGVQPLALAVRNRSQRTGGARESGDAESVSGSGEADRPALAAGDARRTSSDPAGDPTGGPRGGALGGSRRSTRSGLGEPSRHGADGSGRESGGTALGHVDPALMSLIRRLAHSGGGDAGWSGYAASTSTDAAAPLSLPANLIRAHRDELRQASQGAPDHLVIDLIGFLFDQILADPKVPPQMARQIARLQLPVLRAALGDSSFFSSRRHPVRRFVNRIASLGAAFEDFDDAAALALLAKVKSLIQEVVDGDFDQIEVYERKLAELEAFTADSAARGGSEPGVDAAALLSEKEDQQRLRQLYAEQLAGDLKDVAAPPFVREFLGGVWSQVLLRAAQAGDSAGAAQSQRLRNVGRELFLSVQPKATPALRKQFLAELPRLMQDLTAGMNLIGWPEAKRRAFFGQLMPAHADSLKRAPVRTLDLNLMARQVEGALQRPPPSREDLRHSPNLPLLTDAIELSDFSADEARRIGLFQESAIDWSGPLDIDLSVEPEPDADASGSAEPVLPGIAATREAPEPTEGRELANHLQVGFAYRMHLEGGWQKVRLSHVSPGRAFFLFTYGARHRETVSLTRRMLERLCESGRLKAFESAYLIERATARARRQLAQVNATS